jgi:hypothetical protein
MSGNGREGNLAEPGGIEAVSDEALALIDVVPPEEVAAFLAELRGTMFASRSEDLSREPVCNDMGPVWPLGTSSG